VFNTLDLYLEDRHGLSYPGFGDAAASGELSQTPGSDWLVIGAAFTALKSWLAEVPPGSVGLLSIGQAYPIGRSF
jgi:hypothetical protein